MLVLFSPLIAGYFQDKKVNEMMRNLWSIYDIKDNFLLLFHLFDIFSEIVSFPGILVLIWTWSNLIPWRIWCLYQSLPGILNNHQVISNFNSFFKGGVRGCRVHERRFCASQVRKQKFNSVIDLWSRPRVQVIWAQLQIP